MKVQLSKKFLKSFIFFFDSKNTIKRKKIRQALQQVPQAHISKQILFVLQSPLCQRLSPSLGQDKQNGKRAQCQFLPKTSRAQALILLQSHSALSLSRNFAELHVKPVISTWWEIFSNQLCAEHWEMYFVRQKIEVNIFTHAP